MAHTTQKSDDVLTICAICTKSKDPLEYLSIEKWPDLQEVFKADWPRGISGFTILETQRKFINQGFDYGFQVFCPYGDLRNGMVAINEKSDFYEIVIQCPKDNTEELEDALRKTNLINWNRRIILPFTPNHVIECVKRVIKDVKIEIEHILPSEVFILDEKTPLFQNISLPPNTTFGKLTMEYLELIDSTWPHRYPTSTWYFELLIKTNSGYGLFLDNSLISWVFINEAGTLSHMYTLEKYRQKGYSEVLLKLICNIELKEGRDVFAFCVKGNTNACKLYRKVGFRHSEGVVWCYLNGKK